MLCALLAPCYVEQPLVPYQFMYRFHVPGIFQDDVKHCLVSSQPHGAFMKKLCSMFEQAWEYASPPAISSAFGPPAVLSCNLSALDNCCILL